MNRCALALMLISFLLVLVGLTAGRRSLAADLSAPLGQSTPTSQPPAGDREIEGGGSAPDISLIANPSATCTNPVPKTGICYLNWYYFYVTASPSRYIISMTLSIDNQTRLSSVGFFQTDMYIPGDMLKPGFKVACGRLGADGEPALGNAYNYVVRARETSGLTTTNYGLVYCPADLTHIYLPLSRK